MIQLYYVLRALKNMARSLHSYIKLLYEKSGFIYGYQNNSKG